MLIGIATVAFILLQRGAGAAAGAAFGSGASGTVFGARGAGSFMSRSTWVLAMLFCLISLTMAVVVSRSGAQPETDLRVVGAPSAVEVPAANINDMPALDRPTLDMPAMDDGTSETDLPPIGAADGAAADAENPVGPEGDL